VTAASSGHPRPDRDRRRDFTMSIHAIAFHLSGSFSLPRMSRLCRDSFAAVRPGRFSGVRLRCPSWKGKLACDRLRANCHQSCHRVIHSKSHLSHINSLVRTLIIPMTLLRDVVLPPFLCSINLA
jgi:hypothetical protein